MNSVAGNNGFTSTCPTGYNLLSCGNDNKTSTEAWRRSKPLNSTTCQCFDFFGMYCVAWCTTMRVPSFQILQANAKGSISVSCTAGRQAMGCHIRWKGYYCKSAEAKKQSLCYLEVNLLLNEYLQSQSACVDKEVIKRNSLGNNQC